MLRLIVLLLLLANGVYFAWSHDYLKMYGFGPVAPNEPQRMQQQIKPEMIQLLSAADLKKAEAPVPAEPTSKECLQAGPFDEPEAAKLRKALASALPSGSWQLEPLKVSGRWLVYMGRFATADQQAKKRAELAGLAIAAQATSNPALQPGLVLATADSEAQANAELAKLVRKGIRTAKVLQEQEPGVAYQLTLPAVSEALKPKLPDLKGVMADRGFKACS